MIFLSLNAANNYSSSVAELAHTHFQPYPPLWLSAIVLVIIILLGLGIQQNPFFVRYKSMQMFKLSERVSLFDESMRAQNSASVTYTIAAILSTALFIYLVIDGGSFQTKAIGFMLIIAAFLLYHLAKYMVFRFFIGSVFLKKTTVKLITNSYLYLNILLGLTLVPVDILMLYQKIEILNSPLMIFGFVMIGFYYLSLISRLVFIFFNDIASILYLILYLCTLELMPVLLVVKLL